MIMSIADSRSLYPLMVTRGDHAEPGMVKGFNQDGSIEVLQPIPEGNVMLLKNANLAMHRAKLEGRNSVQFFTMEMDDSINERLEMENHLRKAMVLGEFELFYQPQIMW